MFASDRQQPDTGISLVCLHRNKPQPGSTPGPAWLIAPQMLGTRETAAERLGTELSCARPRSAEHAARSGQIPGDAVC